MGKKISLFSKCGACRASLPQVQLHPFLSKERTVHVLLPSTSRKVCPVLQGTEEAPGFLTGQGPLVIISLMLLKVGSTIFLPSGRKGKI